MKQKRASMLFLISLMFLGPILAGAAGVEIRIMPLGDSITFGLGSTNSNGYRKPLYLELTAAGYNFDFVGGQTDGVFPDPNHEGHAGWHADGGPDGGLLYHVYDWLTANPADIILLHIGTNDISASGQDANEVSDILDEIDEFSTDIKVILALIIDRKPHSPATTQFNIDVNNMAQSRIAAGDDIIVVDMESALNYVNDMADSVHPNDDGYAKMADVWYDALDSLFAEEPAIVSTAVTDAVLGQLYTSDVNATGCPVPGYSLTVSPPGMTIDAYTGLIEWEPTTAGNFDVTVQAHNGLLPDANQSFTIAVTTIIEFDSASQASNSVSGTMLNWSHTIGSGNNRILVVGVTGQDDSIDDLVISTVTYNDIPMDLVAGSSRAAGSYPIKTQLYYLLDQNLPPAGSYPVEVTYSGHVDKRCAGAVSLENVEQQPAEVVTTHSVENTDSISTDITTFSNGAWIVDVVGCDSQGLFTVAQNNGQIERFNASTDSSITAGCTALVLSAGPTSMGWSFCEGADQLVHSLAAFAPAKMLVISGYIENFCEVPIAGVVVDANNGGGSDITDANGFYEVWVDYNWSGTVIPSKAHYTFDPNSNAYAYVLDDVIDQNYTATNIYDLDCDGSIGFGDVKIIGENWLEIGEDIPGDFYKDEDDIVNFLDFADFDNVWGD